MIFYFLFHFFPGGWDDGVRTSMENSIIFCNLFPKSTLKLLKRKFQKFSREFREVSRVSKESVDGTKKKF